MQNNCFVISEIFPFLNAHNPQNFEWLVAEWLHCVAEWYVYLLFKLLYAIEQILVVMLQMLSSQCDRAL